MASINLENISVIFPVYGAGRSFRKALFSAPIGGLIGRGGAKEQHITITALKDFTYNFKDGDRVGLIGLNGAGKTTLLRLLANIYRPTQGRISVNGRVSALFSAGLGMDLEDTGYENILTCGLYLGMTPQQIQGIIPDIEEFTELGDFLSLPVRTYSSGMMIRLAFAITTAVHPEILLLDEGLGAGDARFADKAIKRVDDLVSRASILVIASHSEGLVQTMCSTAIFLHEGHVVTSGPVDEVLEAYRKFNEPAQG